MTAIFWLIDTIMQIAIIVVFAHVIMSWLIMFNIVDMRNNIVQQIWHGLNRLTEPVYRPIRRLLPDMGGIDLAPLIFLLGLYFLRTLVFADIRPMLV